MSRQARRGTAEARAHLPESTRGLPLSRLIKTLLAMMVVALALPAFASAITISVDLDDNTPDGASGGVDCGNPSSTNRCDTIAKGIEEAEQFDLDGPGDVVNVLPGDDKNDVYEESLTVSEAGLNIVGPKQNQPASSLPTTGSVETDAIVDPSGAGNSAFTVNAADVRIDGLVIDQADGAGGIALNSTGAAIESNLIRDNTMGVELEGAGSGNSISSNSIRDNDAAGSAAGNGIYVDTDNVDDLDILNNRFTGNDNASASMLSGTTPLENVTVANNVATDEPNAFLNVNGLVDSDITDNQVTGTGCSAMFVGGGDGLGIEQNVIDGSGCSGIRFAGTNDGYEQNTSVTVQGNDITDNGLSGPPFGAGIRIVDEAFAENPGEELDIHANRIFGNAADDTGSNSGGGIRNEENGGETQVDATQNWFGCNEGPAIPSNDCDDVVGASVDTSPHLRFSVTADPTSVNVPGESTITASYRGDSDGGSLSNALASIFPAVPVGFSESGPGDLFLPSTNVPASTVSTSGAQAQIADRSSTAGTSTVTGTSDDDQGDENQETDDAVVQFNNPPPGDSDGDGVANGSDNCLNTANPNQADLDNDGQGDVCDGDVDGDGVANAADACDGQAANTANGCPPSGSGAVGGVQQSNVINGTSGNDTINGTSGDDVINCGAGDDVVNGGGGNDVINCGAGNDRVHGNGGNDRVNGDSGNDRLSGDSGRDRMVGGSGNDRANGNSGNDRVGGQSGNDRVSGSSGNDRVNGENGNDRVSGGSNNDVVSGGNGRDRVSGDSGRDRVSGGANRDRCSGGSGNDRVSGNSGNDRLFGNRGNDRLRGGSGTDALNGGSGDNVLIQ